MFSIGFYRLQSWGIEARRKPGRMFLFKAGQYVKPSMPVSLSLFLWLSLFFLCCKWSTPHKLIMVYLSTRFMSTWRSICLFNKQILWHSENIPLCRLHHPPATPIVTYKLCARLRGRQSVELKNFTPRQLPWASGCGGQLCIARRRRRHCILFNLLSAERKKK